MRREDVIRHVDDYNEELENALYAANAASMQIDEASSDITGRHRDNYNSIVTEADERADEAVRSFLEARHPEDGIVSEEGEDVEGDRVWVVDPLDGSTNFENGSDWWSTSIGLEEDGEPVVGVVHSPESALGKTYFAARDGGAYLLEDGELETLEVNHRELPGSIVISKLADFYPGEIERDISINRELATQKNANIRVYNSGALENCLVAEGVASGFVSHIESPWDYAAAQLIVEEAGGETSVKPSFHGNSQVVASNPEVHEDLVELAEEHLE